MINQVLNGHESPAGINAQRGGDNAVRQCHPAGGEAPNQGKRPGLAGVAAAGD
ncbi:MAG: hypothetical protein ACR5LG_02210 [Sodalis sp. (in: enterobacteria)]